MEGQSHIVWLGNFLDNMVLGYVQARAGQLCVWLGVPATALMTIWGAYFGRAVAAGEIPNALGTLGWQSFHKAFIVGIATVFGVYQWLVLDVVDALVGGMVGFFAPPRSPLVAGANPWVVIDGLNTQAAQLLSDIARDHIDLTEWVVGTIGALFVFLGSATLMLVALWITAQTLFFRGFVLLVGPIFILCTMFKATTGLFFSWLHMLASTIVLTWVAYFVLGVSLFAGQTFVLAANTGLEADNLLKMTFGYVVAMGFMAFVLFNAPTLASGLTGGTPMQLGSQILTQAAMTYLAYAAGKGKGDGGGNATPNQLANIPPASRVPYAAGHAMGSAVGSAGRWAAQQFSRAGSPRP